MNEEILEEFNKFKLSLSNLGFNSKRLDSILLNLIGKMIVGLSLDEADKYHNNIRVTKSNDQPHIVTMDCRLDRINVHTENDIITQFSGVG